MSNQLDSRYKFDVMGDFVPDKGVEIHNPNQQQLNEHAPSISCIHQATEEFIATDMKCQTYFRALEAFNMALEKAMEKSIKEA